MIYRRSKIIVRTSTASIQTPCRSKASELTLQIKIAKTRQALARPLKTLCCPNGHNLIS